MGSAPVASSVTSAATGATDPNGRNPAIRIPPVLTRLVTVPRCGNMMMIE
jgi:hypothetical protein